MKSKTLKTLAKSLDFENERQAANYIFESWVNGNYSEVKEMFQSLTDNEKSNCLFYIREFQGDEKEVFSMSICALSK